MACVTRKSQTGALNSVNVRVGCNVVNNFVFICSLAALNTTQVFSLCLIRTLCLHFIILSWLCNRSDTQRYHQEPVDTEKNIKVTKLSGLFSHETVVTIDAVLWLSCSSVLLAPPTGFKALLPLEEGNNTENYVQRDIEARSRNHWCSGKTISVTYSVCVFVALGIHHSMEMRHIVTCGLPGCITFHVTL
jgi:hypothetical protein